MEFLSGLEHPEPQRIWQAKQLMRSVTYATRDLAFDRFVDKPEQRTVICEMWRADGEAEWQSWYAISYDRLDMKDVPTAVLLCIVDVENWRDGKMSMMKVTDSHDAG